MRRFVVGLVVVVLMGVIRPAFAEEPSPIERLSSPVWAERLLAQWEIWHAGESFQAELLALLADETASPEARTAALALAGAQWNEQVQRATLVALQSYNPIFRRLAADVLAQQAKPGEREVLGVLLKAMAETDPTVKRSIALALSQLGGAEMADVLVNTLRFDDREDPALTEGLIVAVERSGSAGIREIINLAESGDAASRTQAVNMISELRSPEAVAGILELIANPHLNDDQLIQLFRSIISQRDSAPPLNPLIDYLLGSDTSDEVRATGWQVLASVGSIREQARLIELLQTSRDTSNRVAVLRVLRGIKSEEAIPLFQEIVLEEGDVGPVPHSLRTEALAALAELAPDQAFDAASTILTKTEPPLQTEAVRVLSTRPDGAKLLGERYLAKELPQGTRQAVLAALKQHAEARPDLQAILDALSD